MRDTVKAWLYPVLIYLMKYICPRNIVLPKRGEVCLANEKPSIIRAKGKRSKVENKTYAYPLKILSSWNLRLWWERGWSFSYHSPISICPCVFSLLDEQTQSKLESDELRLDPVWDAAEEPGAADFISTSNIKIKGNSMGREGIHLPLKQNTKHRGGYEERTLRRYNLEGPTCSIRNIPLSFSPLSLSCPKPSGPFGLTKETKRIPPSPFSNFFWERPCIFFFFLKNTMLKLREATMEMKKIQKCTSICRWLKTQIFVQ